VLSYVDDHRESLKKEYSSFEEYRDRFRISNKIMDGLFDHAEKEGVSFNKEEYEISGDHIKLRIRGQIPSYLCTTAELYEIINEENPDVIKALEVLGEQGIYQALLQEIR
jgi:carboxyl-terminal processing protease